MRKDHVVDARDAVRARKNDCVFLLLTETVEAASPAFVADRGPQCEVCVDCGASAGVGGFSQVGLATMKSDVFFFKP